VPVTQITASVEGEVATMFAFLSPARNPLRLTLEITA